MVSGLVHVSQMSSARIEDPAEMLAKGEKVYCKVISVEVDFYFMFFCVVAAVQ